MLMTALVALLAFQQADAQQPYGGCWHPEDITDWSPETDPDAKFNRSVVPLAQRFKEPTLMKANKNQYYEGQVCDATILFPTCSMCPSQGAYNFLGYQPTYWQYMDKLVYWAGSASEGIIIPPPAPSIDAAHQSGVKVLGQVFFPPAAYGGQQIWVRQMLTVENGHYIYAKKLYEIAKYMGFDGWFINEETGGGSTSEWVGFIKEFNAVADAAGDTQMEIQWYNASGYPSIDILKAHKNTSQFLEYGSVGDKRSYASELGCTEAETFQKLYGGIQCVYSGLTGYGTTLRSAFPTTGHVGSVDLFCPEERVWKDNVKNYLNSTENNHGAVAWAAMEKTFQNEEKMWVNEAGDPSTGGTSSWPGFSGCILERSVISSMPFVTSFSVGDGKYRFVNGEKQAEQDWYHSGVQSIMPTWRWWIENKGTLKGSIDWDDAYNFGASAKISGTLSAGDHLVRLYKTQVPVTAGGTLRLVYKTSTAGSVEVKLSTASSTTPDVTLSNPTTSEKNGWTVADYDLSSLNGKTIYMIALNLKADTEVAAYTLNLGELALLPAGYAPAPVEVTNLQNGTTLGEEKGDLRLTWDYTYNNDFDHFDVYTVTESGTRTLVGQTRGEGFYVPSFEREGVDSKVTVEVVPVMKDMNQAQAVTLDVNYPQATAPVVTFSLSKSYVKVGETVTITANGTGHPTGYKWTLPAGLELAEGSSLTDNPITVVAKEAGKQSVTVEATNSVGTSTTTREVVDVFASDAELKGVYNVVLNKTVVDYSGSTNSSEVPSKIIDGVTNPNSTADKWCNVSSDNWAIFDCQAPYRIYGFKIYDGNAGPESGVDQIDSYQIQLSMDGQNWTTVVDRSGAEKETIKTDYIAPTKGRYVRLVPHVNGTLRIWEFEVYGMDASNLTVSGAKELTMQAGETKNVTVKYDLNGDERAASFTCTATSESGNLSFGKITEDKDASTFTIPVTAGKVIGTDVITVKVDNGGSYKLHSINVTIDDANQPNILSGLTAEVRQYKGDYGFGVAYDKYDNTKLTDGDTETEGLAAIENPSKYKNDLWAIFTAPNDGTWNLSKVKIFVPGKNYSTNDNGVDGYVNNTITIYAGNDINSLTPLKTYSNLEEVSSLEYILPKYKTVKYLAIACNLNAYFYPSLAEVEAYEQLEDAIPVNGPLDATGWNADVIAEAKPAADHSSMALDDQGWVLYTTGVQESGAISDDSRIVKTASGQEFTLNPYDQNNALFIGRYGEATLTLSNPENIEKLYFLAISANGGANVTATVTYEDGTSADSSLGTIEDWWSPYERGNEAVYGLGRIIRAAKDGYSADQFGDLYFRLFESSMDVDKSKKLESITFNNNSSAYPTILAITKIGVKSSTGIERVNGAEGDQTVTAIYNLNGMRLNKLQKGVNILKLANGTTRKVIVR